MGDPVRVQVMLLENEAEGLICLREQRQDGWEKDPVVVDDEETGGSPGLFCRTCGYRITSDDQRISVNGSHTHTFFNPAGLVFELGCFGRAPGCLIGNQASTLFTWFAGFAWRPVSCARCAVHLGWRFEKDDAVFFSLILASLTDRR
jgi:hypothetical protein